MVKRVLTGIDADDDHCAADLISSIGPGGTFLAEDHTIRHMRADFFLPSVGEISDWHQWNKKERPTALEKARQKAKDTIASHSVPPLPDAVVKQIRDVFPDMVIDTA